MMKKYQENVVEEVNEYLNECKIFNSPRRGFVSKTERPYINTYSKIPFICVKIPTGGGKTFVACNVINSIYDIYLKDKLNKGIILWFVPSDAIKSQTINKLKDKNNFHRKAIDDYFDNKVRIYSNEEALRIRKSDVDNNVCIIIASIDSFRKEKRIQNKYKVYQDNGTLLNFFENIDENADLEKDKGGIVNSLANVIRLCNPLIVIDEGHRTKTELSEDILKDLNPSFIIEFTATPRKGSNIISEVSSLELKQEEMVKLPIVLESVSQWENAVNRGVNQRNELEKLSKKQKKEYIRPIALLQAEQEKESDKKITVAKLKEFLIKDKGIPEEHIAIKTSKHNELENLNLLSKSCKIRYIITVKALAEGWDCPFAYVLISVANIGAKVSVEQIIGRIMRLPYVKLKSQRELNRSFIFTSAKNFREAAKQIISALERNGYQKEDLISHTETKKTSNYEVNKRIKEDFFVPMMSVNGELLQFSDLIGSDFKLSQQEINVDGFESFYDSDGRLIIDITDENKWLEGRQTILNITYHDKNFSELELITWLDKKLRFVELDKKDKRKFISGAIKKQLDKCSLSELSVNRFVFKDFLKRKINEIIQNYTKKRFDELYKKGKFSLHKFEPFPPKIEISKKVNEKFKNNYYEELDPVNKEELEFLRRLDTELFDNMKFWIRSREKKDPFYIQGWRKNKFYPDFVALTKKGNVVVIEWKGMDRVSNEDTKYKVKLGELYSSLGKGKIYFFLAHVENIEEVLNKIKNL